MKWLIKEYMGKAHIDSITELADLTGITRRTLYDRINNPATIRAYEITALDEVLHFDADDLIKLATGLKGGKR